MWEMHYSRHKSKYVLHYLYYNLQHVLKMYSIKYTKRINVQFQKTLNTIIVKWAILQSSTIEQNTNQYLLFL